MISRLTVRVESVRGPLMGVGEVREHLSWIIAAALPGTTTSRLSMWVQPDGASAIFQLFVMTLAALTRDETYLIEVGVLELLPSPLHPRTLEPLGPDVTVHAEPLALRGA